MLGVVFSACFLVHELRVSFNINLISYKLLITPINTTETISYNIAALLYRYCKGRHESTHWFCSSDVLFVNFHLLFFVTQRNSALRYPSLG